MNKPISSSSSGSSSSSVLPGRPRIHDVTTGKKIKRMETKYVTDAISKKRILRKNATIVKGKWYSKVTLRKLVQQGKTMIPRTSIPIPEKVKEDYYTWAVNFLFEKVLTENSTKGMFVKLYHFVVTILINLSFTGFSKFLAYIQIARRLKYYKESLLKSKKLRQRLNLLLKWVQWLYFACRSKEDMSYSYSAPQKSPTLINYKKKEPSPKRIGF